MKPRFGSRLCHPFGFQGQGWLELGGKPFISPGCDCRRSRRRPRVGRLVRIFLSKTGLAYFSGRCYLATLRASCGSAVNRGVSTGDPIRPDCGWTPVALSCVGNCGDSCLGDCGGQLQMSPLSDRLGGFTPPRCRIDLVPCFKILWPLPVLILAQCNV